jgi:hypothetical protein
MGSGAGAVLGLSSRWTLDDHAAEFTVNALVVDIRRGTRPIMRKIFALVAAAALVVLSACGGKPASADPYQVLDQATTAAYGDLVQLNLGVDVTGSQSVHVDPSAIQLIVDTKGGRADVAVSLPVDALQLDAATRAQMGLTGDTLDLDIRFDGTAVYTKSPLLQSLLTALVLQSGGTPGDYSGWVQLGTTAELGALAAGLVPQMSLGPVASAGPLGSHDAASLKTDLEDAGITLTYAGQEQRSGQKADHLTASIDASKLGSSPLASEVPGGQLSQVKDALAQADLTGDLWFDADSHKLMEVDVTAVDKGSAQASASASGATATFVLRVSTPKDASALEAPATYSKVPLGPIIQSLLQSFGGAVPPI